MSNDLNRDDQSHDSSPHGTIPLSDSTRNPVTGTLDACSSASQSHAQLFTSTVLPLTGRLSPWSSRSQSQPPRSDSVLNPVTGTLDACTSTSQSHAQIFKSTVLPLTGRLSPWSPGSHSPPPRPEPVVASVTSTPDPWSFGSQSPLPRPDPVVAPVTNTSDPWFFGSQSPSVPISGATHPTTGSLSPCFVRTQQTSRATLPPSLGIIPDTGAIDTSSDSNPFEFAIATTSFPQSFNEVTSTDTVFTKSDTTGQPSPHIEQSATAIKLPGRLSPSMVGTSEIVPLVSQSSDWQAATDVQWASHSEIQRRIVQANESRGLPQFKLTPVITERQSQGMFSSNGMSSSLVHRPQADRTSSGSSQPLSLHHTRTLQNPAPYSDSTSLRGQSSDVIVPEIPHQAAPQGMEGIQSTSDVMLQQQQADVMNTSKSVAENSSPVSKQLRHAHRSASDDHVSVDTVLRLNEMTKSNLKEGINLGFQMANVIAVNQREPFAPSSISNQPGDMIQGHLHEPHHDSSGCLALPGVNDADTMMDVTVTRFSDTALANEHNAQVSLSTQQSALTHCATVQPGLYVHQNSSNRNDEIRAHSLKQVQDHIRLFSGKLHHGGVPIDADIYKFAPVADKIDGRLQQDQSLERRHPILRQLVSYLRTFKDAWKQVEGNCWDQLRDNAQQYHAQMEQAQDMNGLGSIVRAYLDKQVQTLLIAEEAILKLCQYFRNSADSLKAAKEAIDDDDASFIDTSMELLPDRLEEVMEQALGAISFSELGLSARSLKPVSASALIPTSGPQLSGVSQADWLINYEEDLLEDSEDEAGNGSTQP